MYRLRKGLQVELSLMSGIKLKQISDNLDQNNSDQNNCKIERTLKTMFNVIYNAKIKV